MGIPQRPKDRNTIQPSNPITGYIPKGIDIILLYSITHMYVHCSTIHSRKDMESTQMPINDRLHKENVAHIHDGMLCNHKKEQYHVLCKDIDGAGGHYLQ